MPNISDNNPEAAFSSASVRALIESFRSLSSKDSVSPDSLGYLLDCIARLVQNLETAAVPSAPGGSAAVETQVTAEQFESLKQRVTRVERDLNYKQNVSDEFAVDLRDRIGGGYDHFDSDAAQGVMGNCSPGDLLIIRWNKNVEHLARIVQMTDTVCAAVEASEDGNAYLWLFAPQGCSRNKIEVS